MSTTVRAFGGSAACGVVLARKRRAEAEVVSGGLSLEIGADPVSKGPWDKVGCARE